MEQISLFKMIDFWKNKKKEEYFNQQHLINNIKQILNPQQIKIIKDGSCFSLSALFNYLVFKNPDYIYIITKL